MLIHKAIIVSYTFTCHFFQAADDSREQGNLNERKRAKDTLIVIFRQKDDEQRDFLLFAVDV